MAKKKKKSDKAVVTNLITSLVQLITALVVLTTVLLDRGN